MNKDVDPIQSLEDRLTKLSQQATKHPVADTKLTEVWFKCPANSKMLDVVLRLICIDKRSISQAIEVGIRRIHGNPQAIAAQILEELREITQVYSDEDSGK